MVRRKNKLTVHDYMSADPFTVEPEDSLQRVVDLLRRHDIRSVPVLQDGRLVGIVSDRDLRQVAPSYPLFRDEDEIRRYTENLKVTAAMTADPMRISPAASLVEAAKVLESYRISSLPVVDGESLVGIISVSDLLRAFVDQNEEVSNEARRHYGRSGDSGVARGIHRRGRETDA
jgi:acetoin utilization protein AcuB